MIVAPWKFDVLETNIFAQNRSFEGKYASCHFFRKDMSARFLNAIKPIQAFNKQLIRYSPQ